MLAMGLFRGGGGEIKKSPMKIPGLVYDWRYLLSNPMPSSNESSGTGISTGKGKSVTFFSRIGQVSGEGRGETTTGSLWAELSWHAKIKKYQKNKKNSLASPKIFFLAGREISNRKIGWCNGKDILLKYGGNVGAEGMRNAGRNGQRKLGKKGWRNLRHLGSTT